MSSDFFKLYDDVLDRTVHGVFGEKVEYRPLSGGRYNIKAVFDRSHARLNPDTEQVVSVTEPRLGVKLSDIPGEPRQGDQVRINTEFFEVREIEPDGQGHAFLWLTILSDV